MAGRLQGKAAIVTGAGSGIGREAALLFASEGAAVVCADIDGEGAQQTAARCGESGGHVFALAVDVSSEPDMERMAFETHRSFGRIDILYANAGVTGVGTAHGTDRTDWDRVLAINLTGVWLSAKHVLPHMREQGGGSIINQASIGGLQGFRGLAPYAAAKGGVIALTRQMAIDYGRRNIRVNAICPGTVPTPLVAETIAVREGLVGSDAAESYRVGLAQYPLGRYGTERDVANLALFLASDDAAWISGGIYVIDGGFTAA